ncbi:MAG: nucleotidyltransferase domain-containing protein [Chloroflexi bacterium]|nr:nucleotidyltransferase domain-containing protein [Chloroflexota bacterium]
MKKATQAIFPKLELLPGIFKKYPGVQAVYLFGSTASGNTNAESDLDLAVVPLDSSVRAAKLDILTDLARNGFCNVDLVILDTENILLKFQAIRQNRLLYSNKEFNSGDYFSLTLRQYFDFLPYLKIQRESERRRILHDGTDRSYS